MLEVIAVITSQFSLVFFKHLNIIKLVENAVIKTMVLTAMVQISWLISSAIGINALLNSDYITVTAYIIAGVIGSYFALKIGNKKEDHELQNNSKN